MSVWVVVAHVAASQYGLVATWQLTALGISAGVLSSRATRDGWERVHRGVWALPGSVDTPRRSLMAAVLAVGRPAPAQQQLLAQLAREVAAGARQPQTDAPLGLPRPVVGVTVMGPWAAHLLGLLDQPAHGPTLLVPSERYVVPPNGVDVHTSGGSDAAAVRVVAGLPVTGVNRTLCDLGRWLGEERVAVTIAKACRLRATSVRSVEAELERRGRFPGRTTVAAAVRALRGELVHSGAERLARRALRELGLHPHPAPLDLVHDGRVIAQADIPFVEERVDVEVDGPHHFLPEQAAKDRVRDRELKALLDWTTLRFTVYEVERDPRGFALEVNDTVQSRRAA